MSATRSTASQKAYRQSLRLTFACEFAAVREAVGSARTWLVEQGIGEVDLSAWELALVEACNNAVEYTSGASRNLPVGLEISCGESDIEARITDHTPGFDLPADSTLPDVDSEGGRGLFLIRSLVDRIVYLRGNDENVLCLRKRRPASSPLEQPDPVELQRRLAEGETAIVEMTEELASCYESMVAMFRYSAELGTNADLLAFARRLLNDLLLLTETDAGVIRLFDAVGRLETYLATPEELESGLSRLDGLDETQSLELEATRTRADAWFGIDRPLKPSDPLNVIRGVKLGITHAFELGGQALGAVTLARTRTATPLRAAQVNLLHTLTDYLAIQVVNSRLLNERTLARLTRRELEIAANIQRSLLPVHLPQCPPFELAASSLSAREVGGDFYDVIRVGERGLLLVIADVMGKGVPAALFAAVVRNSIRSRSELFENPGMLLTAVNRTLCEDLSRVDMFVTVKVVFLDMKNTRLVSASAGHCPLLVLQPGQSAPEPADDSGLPVGIDSGPEYVQTLTAFHPGAIAVLYTDGVTESRNPAGEMFGEGRLARALPELARHEKWADGINLVFERMCESHRAGAPLTDDQTFVLLRHTP